jgi:macrolide-specific efflux system membrane fusion protein
LQYIEPTPEVTNNVVLYNALFKVDNQEGRLLPQMTAQVFFIQDEALNVLRVPVSAVARNQVKVLDAKGQLQIRAVETGISNRVYVEVRSGVSEGDQVVLANRDPRAAQGDGRSAFRGMLR